MEIQTETFVRTPSYADVVEVTEENMQAVAEWCGGEILNTDGKPFIQVDVHQPANERHRKAYVGDRITYANFGFKVFNPPSFKKAWTPTGETKMMAPPKRRKRKQPANPVLNSQQAAQARTNSHQVSGEVRPKPSSMPQKKQVFETDENSHAVEGSQ